MIKAKQATTASRVNDSDTQNEHWNIVRVTISDNGRPHGIVASVGLAVGASFVILLGVVASVNVVVVVVAVVVAVFLVLVIGYCWRSCWWRRCSCCCSWCYSCC